jgi:hypothetical protein
MSDLPGMMATMSEQESGKRVPSDSQVAIELAPIPTP